MRLSLAVKMFVALFGITAVTVGSVVTWTSLTLRDSFSVYVATVALSQMDRQVEALQRSFAAHGDWSGLRDDPVLWAGLMRGGPPPRPWQGPTEPPPGADRPPPSPGGFRAEDDGPPPGPPSDADGNGPGERLVLEDTAGHPVVGQPERLSHPGRRRLSLNGRPIGVLLLDAGPIPHGMEATFLTDRLRDLYRAGALAVLLSGVAAVLLARHILAPIGLVTAAARRMASGDLAARIPTGRRDELGELVLDVNALARSLELSEASRRQWVADTSHELRTPLAVLQAQIEALQDGVQPVSERALGNLHGEVGRMNRLVSDLHDLSRADCGALGLRLEALEAGTLMAEVLTSFDARREAREIRVDAHGLAGASGPVNADSLKLRQVFGNILENAIRYTDPGGLIRVEGRVDGDRVAITVEDTAPGVPSSKLPLIFDRFFRVDMSRSRETGGSGLGLSICRAIVEAHAGTIEARPSVLGGLAVSVLLPMARAT